VFSYHELFTPRIWFNLENKVWDVCEQPVAFDGEIDGSGRNLRAVAMIALPTPFLP
jgi:hypothetical protein